MFLSLISFTKTGSLTLSLSFFHSILQKSLCLFFLDFITSLSNEFIITYLISCLRIFFRFFFFLSNRSLTCKNHAIIIFHENFTMPCWLFSGPVVLTNRLTVGKNHSDKMNSTVTFPHELSFFFKTLSFYFNNHYFVLVSLRNFQFLDQ